MKATLDLPAPLLRKLMTEAAAKGQAIGQLVADKLASKSKRKAMTRKWTTVGQKLTLEQYLQHTEETRSLMSSVPTVTDEPVAEVLSKMRR